MKKFTFRSLLAIAAAGVLFTACKDENDDGNTSKTTYEFSVKAKEQPAFKSGTSTFLFGQRILAVSPKIGRASCRERV